MIDFAITEELYFLIKESKKKEGPKSLKNLQSDFEYLERIRTERRVNNNMKEWCGFVQNKEETLQTKYWNYLQTQCQIKQLIHKYLALKSQQELNEFETNYKTKQ